MTIFLPLAPTSAASAAPPAAMTRLNVRVIAMLSLSMLPPLDSQRTSEACPSAVTTASAATFAIELRMVLLLSGTKMERIRQDEETFTAGVGGGGRRFGQRGSDGPITPSGCEGL